MKLTVNTDLNAELTVTFVRSCAVSHYGASVTDEEEIESTGFGNELSGLESTGRVGNTDDT